MEYPFDKYAYYRIAVQSPDSDCLRFKTIHNELTDLDLVTLGEDFCGTFAISCEWVKMGANLKSVGVDLSEEAIGYGKKHYLSELSKDQQSRVEIVNANVLDPKLPKADCIAAMNFSYFIFKTRAELKSYFANVYHRLPEGGTFICDCFGGPDSLQNIEEETENDEGFSFFWDQEWYDPINNFSMYHIHFQPKDGKKYEKVFSYDWRMWSIPEIREVLTEVGFKSTHAYWEGTGETEEDGRGDGDGEFVLTEATTEECDTWVAMLAAVK